MDLLQQAVDGFEKIDAEPAYKEAAAHHLQRWLTEADARRAKAELLATAPAVRSNNN